MSNFSPPSVRITGQPDGNFRVPRPPTPLEFTGERMTSAAEGQIEFEHYHRYCFTRDMCGGLDVLDVASGEGYGAAILAGVARSVIGVEIDTASVAHAETSYRAANLRFLQGDALALPLPDSSVDIVVSFETLEHLADHGRFITEIKRVLRPNGIFVVSTPDRNVYSAPGSEPNPYHVLELTDPEFRAFLTDHFVHVSVLTQRPVLGSVLAANSALNWRSYERRGPDIIEATTGLARAHYLVAVATDGAPPPIASSVYLDRRRVHDVIQSALRLPEIERQASGFADELKIARAEAARNASEVVALQARLNDAEEKAAELKTRYDATIYSTSWRVLTPIRSVGQRHPRMARLLRRSVKLVWWTATLQLGHRYLSRRRWRAEQAAKLEIARAEAAHSASEVVALQARLNGGAAINFPPVIAPEVSVIIPVYKGFPDLENCLRSLAVSRASEPVFEVILIDDCPEESVLWAIPNSGGLIKVSNAENMGFLLTCNRGAGLARGRILCFLNSDTIVFPDWLRSLVDVLDNQPDAALAGGMLLNVDGTIQDGGWRILGNGWGHPIGRGGNPRDGSYTYRRPVDCVTGACFAMPKRVFDDLGGFDPLYAPAFYEEFDLAFRAQARGLKVIYEPKSRVIHVGSTSYGAERRDALSAAHQATFAERFAERLRKHPWDITDEFTLRHGPSAGPVLLLVDYGIPHPDRHAGDVTISRYLSLLATGGWRVVFGPMDGNADGPAADALERQGIELIRAPQTIEGWLGEHGRHVDQVWLARPEIAETLIESVRRLTTARIAYYPHDLHHVRLQREADLRPNPALDAEVARVRDQEQAVFRAVDCVSATCDNEADIIRRIAPETPVIVLPPYFYETAEIHQYDSGHFGGLSDIVFVGGFPHIPNVDAALFIANDIMPIVWKEQPQVRLVLVGYAPPPEVLALAGPRILVTGQVPKVEPFLDQARLVLAALRFGAGVKGKIVDALRLGVPVVTTTVGAEGISIEPGRDALVADDAVGLAECVLELFRDDDRCSALSAAGAALVRQRFSRGAARAAVGAVFHMPRCSVCGSHEMLGQPTDGNFRESFVCLACFSLARSEALARVMLSRLAPDGEGSLAELARRRPSKRVHEFGFVGGIADTLRGQDWYSVSEYFDDVKTGSVGPGGVRCEDLTRLTFADASFDLVISQDVMEHVSDPVAAFAEIARVLRTGGSHIFTIPQNRELPNSITRARLAPFGVEYLLPPEYHGDPIRAQGALVFTNFGADLRAILEGIGLNLIEHDLPVLGGSARESVRVFEALKPITVATADPRYM